MFAYYAYSENLFIVFKLLYSSKAPTRHYGNIDGIYFNTLYSNTKHQNLGEDFYSFGSNMDNDKITFNSYKDVAKYVWLIHGVVI